MTVSFVDCFWIRLESCFYLLNYIQCTLTLCELNFSLFQFLSLSIAGSLINTICTFNIYFDYNFPVIKMGGLPSPLLHSLKKKNTKFSAPQSISSQNLLTVLLNRLHSFQKHLELAEKWILWQLKEKKEKLSSLYRTWRLELLQDYK